MGEVSGTIYLSILTGTTGLSCVIVNILNQKGKQTNLIRKRWLL